MHRLYVSGSGSGGFDVDDPPVDIQDIDKSLDSDSSDLAFYPELHRRRFYCRRHFVEVLNDERLTGPGELRRILIIAKLDLIALTRPSFAEERENTIKRQVLVGFNLLREVLCERGMNGSAQN